MAEKASHSTILRERVRTPGKLIIAFLFAPVILIAIGSGIWLNFISEQNYRAALEYRKLDTGEREAYFTLPEVLVDLQPDGRGAEKFIKTQITIALGTEKADETARRLEAEKPAILERITLFMRELEPADFQGTDAMVRVKAETARRINLVIAPHAVSEVLFEELVIQ